MISAKLTVPGVLFVSALVGSGTPLLAQNASVTPTAPYERRAAEIVRGFVAAFDAKDAGKATENFEDDVQFRMEVALNRNIEIGRENARQRLQRLFDRASRAAAAGTQAQPRRIELVQTEAIGDSKIVLVITRRIDHTTINGRALDLPVGSFFRVNAQTGKIEEWLDIPLIAFDRNPAPATAK